MRKQDKQGVRTPADLERKYHFGKNMGAAQKAASDATRAAERAVAAAGNALGRNEYDQIVAMLNRAHAIITRLVVQSRDFSLDAQGNMAVKKINLNGSDLESRLVAIESKLGGSVAPNPDDDTVDQVIDKGTVVVGQSWNIIGFGEIYDNVTVIGITGGISISIDDRENGVWLQADSSGEATVTIRESYTNTVQQYVYNVIDA